MLSCCWVLCCVPVGTIGAACIALYDATAHCVRGGEGGMYRRFFRTFKNELGRGFLLTLFWAVIGFFLNASYQILTQLAQQSNGWTVFSLVYFISLFIHYICCIFNPFIFSIMFYTIFVNPEIRYNFTLLSI